MKVLQFLTNNLRHFTTQLGIFHVCKDEIQRCPGRLLFAMRVVDKDRRQVGVDLREPALGRFTLKMKHSFLSYTVVQYPPRAWSKRTSRPHCLVLKCPRL